MWREPQAGTGVSGTFRAVITPKATLIHLLTRGAIALSVAVALVALGIAHETPWLIPVGILAGLVAAAATMGKPYRAWRAATAPLSPELIDILERKVRIYRALDESDRERFARRIARMLVTLDFEAVKGAKDSLELRVLALAGASALLIGRDDLHMSEYRSVVFYPDAFSADYDHHDANFAGMVHRQGPVLFSTRALAQGWQGGDDGYNVSIHEWAHVLDLDDGFADGIPGLARTSLMSTQETLKDELASVRGGSNALRDYAGTNRAELFAVATEVFFERPKALSRSHPELYELLRDWLAIDPIELLADVPAPPQKKVEGTRRERRAAAREAKKKADKAKKQAARAKS